MRSAARRLDLVAAPIFALISCQAEEDPPSHADVSSPPTAPFSSTPRADDHRAAALARLRAGEIPGLQPCWNEPDRIDYSTGAVVVDRDDFSCSSRMSSPAYDSDREAREVSRAEAFLASERTCLIHVRVAHLWCVYPEIVLELARTREGWIPVTSALWWMTDCNAIDQSGHVLSRWEHPLTGAVRIDGSTASESGPIRVSLHLESQRSDGPLSVNAVFEVVPTLMPSDRPFIVERYIRDSQVEERW